VIRRKVKFENLLKQKSCEICTNAFRSYLGGLFSNKEFCEFCMNYVCSGCIHRRETRSDKLGAVQDLFQGRSNAISQKDLQTADELKRALFFPRSVCQKYSSKILGYRYLQINHRNPYLLKNKQLRDIMCLRRVCHQIFDSIKC